MSKKSTKQFGTVSECGCPRGGGTKNGHIRCPLLWKKEKELFGGEIECLVVAPSSVHRAKGNATAMCVRRRQKVNLSVAVIPMEPVANDEDVSDA